MEISEVTIFKLIFFIICVVLITIFVTKITNFSPTDDNRCISLNLKQDILDSIIKSSGENCPEGYYRSYGEFKDVKKEMKCCVKYE